MTLLEAGRALRTRSLSCAELTHDALERIARLNPSLNAFITVTGLAARARAEALDQELADGIDRGPLHGIPIAHKDCFSTKGVRTTGGSKILADRVPDHDAEMVAQLDRAGAVILGKTNLHELCYGITSNNPHFGAVHNPWDLERIPGGSSGGSAAAVAAELVFAASGTDTGGSIRVPAAFCGVVGLKPTYGRLSRRGVLPLGLTLDHVGPIARTVGDTAACYRAMAGQPPVLSPPRGVAGLRIGVPANFFFDTLAPEITSSIRHAVQTMAALGAHVMEVQLPEMDALNSIGRLVLSAEASSIWKRYLDQPANFGEDVFAALERGCLVPATEYLDAQRQRRVLSKRLAKLWTGIDCLLCPATPTTAPRIGDAVIRIGGLEARTGPARPSDPSGAPESSAEAGSVVRARPFEEDVRVGSTRLVRPFNVLGWPALAMPCGFSDAGLPIGLQLVAAPDQEETLFRAGEALEGSLGLSQSKIPRTPPRSKPDTSR